MNGYSGHANPGSEGVWIPAEKLTAIQCDAPGCDRNSRHGVYRNGAHWHELCDEHFEQTMRWQDDPTLENTMLGWESL